MPVWLVTGGAGFLGRHVLAALGGSVDVLAMGRRCPMAWPSSRFVAADLEQTESVARGLRLARPDVVIHAAGRTPPAETAMFYRANTLATAQLLDALQAQGRAVRVVLAGSAAELGPVDPSALPADEDHPCRPGEPYAMSKWLATCAGMAARRPVEVVSARVFNPIGPGQPLKQALGRFAALLAVPADGPLMVGDLDARRDFVDVRDVARALIALAEQGRAGSIYNVGTGESHRVGEGLDHLIHRSGRSVELRTDPRLIASSGPGDSRADIGRIVDDTDWRPEVPWEQSLDDLWAEAVAQAQLPLTA